ncbi:hypothetical protein U1Q18_022480 [Sarracenia purpurea var. burkii]
MWCSLVSDDDHQPNQVLVGIAVVVGQNALFGNGGSVGEKKSNEGAGFPVQKRYIGVRIKTKGRWCAEIRDRRCWQWLDTFYTTEEAALAYDAMRGG